MMITKSDCSCKCHVEESDLVCCFECGCMDTKTIDLLYDVGTKTGLIKEELA
jgi:hypothetical protein